MVKENDLKTPATLKKNRQRGGTDFPLEIRSKQKPPSLEGGKICAY
jgi:hypothetical protein